MIKEIVIAITFFLLAIFFINTALIETNALVIVFELLAICIFMILGSISVILIITEHLVKKDDVYQGGYPD